MEPKTLFLNKQFFISYHDHEVKSLFEYSTLWVISGRILCYMVDTYICSLEVENSYNYFLNNLETLLKTAGRRKFTQHYARGSLENVYLCPMAHSMVSICRPCSR